MRRGCDSVAMRNGIEDTRGGAKTNVISSPVTSAPQRSRQLRFFEDDIHMYLGNIPLTKAMI